MPILQMTKVRHREVKSFAQGKTATFSSSRIQTQTDRITQRKLLKDREL